MQKDGIKIISFDVEGTLVTTDFSYAIWFELIPRRYAQKHNMQKMDAMEKVRDEYGKVGDQRLEWYDVQYWFDHFGFGKADIAMEELQPMVTVYPDAGKALDMLAHRYKLNVASGSPRPFLKHLLRDIEHQFTSVFSSVSDYQQVKKAAFYEKMCRELNVDPRQVVHVGDNYQFDVIEPASIGIRSFFLDRAGKSTDITAVHDLQEFANIFLVE
jgi:FMN phosphatase YigB (HAD superfamily)